MRLSADIGISQTTVIWLNEQRFDAIHVRDSKMHRASDTEIIRKAKKEKRIVLTCDLDFGDIVSASGEKCPSVIILRLENETPSNVNSRLKQVLKESSEDLKKGAIISVEETRHRVRPLPL
ncbi:hypothetical protein HKBW3S42_01967 [Candidatus Hakubella thermalkaliphila]|uniref:DUF5615 domain-containing protein n=1 Tax=Candidatus Hakubella thermalkaliphila TaxID=2754717 RepID=A0A6V8PNB5_9ACTN|nr:hypothetical protein HKBW3S42_01967 [Candidatus Hakubella thermalkaliphila]